MARLKYWVWLSALDGVRPLMKYRLTQTMGGPDKIFFASREELMQAAELRPGEADKLMNKSLEQAEKILGECDRLYVRVITVQDSEYPERLLNIADPPIVLYVQGRLPVIDEETVIAVVGTRHATGYGLKMAAKIAGEITKGGGIVVSGLAAGCDGAAMEAALRAGGTTIGVLGTSIDKVYPAENRELFREVRTRGALISEYGPGVRTYASSFTARNRIISGLSVGIVVAEAPEHSGTRNTVRHALEQGRDVFAVPGNADAPVSAGCNDLIAEGAYVAECGRDVLQMYESMLQGRPRTPAPKQEMTLPRPTHIKKEIDNKKDIVYIDVTERVSKLPAVQQKILSVMTRPDMYADEITEAAALTAGETLAALTMLQIGGFVSQGAGKRYTRKY